MRITDVHMAVDKCRHKHSASRVDGPLRLCVAQFVCLTHMRDPVALDDHRRIGHHPPPGIDGDDIGCPLYLQ